MVEWLVLGEIGDSFLNFAELVVEWNVLDLTLTLGGGSLLGRLLLVRDWGSSCRSLSHFNYGLTRLDILFTRTVTGKRGHVGGERQIVWNKGIAMSLSTVILWATLDKDQEMQREQKRGGKCKMQKRTNI